VSSPPRVKSEELLAPEDIKITYSEAENPDRKDPAGSADPRHPLAALASDDHSYENFEAWNRCFCYCAKFRNTLFAS
jgi:hypothetical protein